MTRPWRARAVVATGLLAALTTASCGAPHSGVTSGQDSCALVVPLATRTIHHHGSLIAVRTLPLPLAQRLVHAAGNRTRLAAGHYCVVAYLGSFPRPSGPPAKVAVVVAQVQPTHLLGVLWRQRVPPHLRPDLG